MICGQTVPPCALEGGGPGSWEVIIKDVHGNTSGLKPSELKALSRLARRRTPGQAFVGPELVRALAEQSRSINRQVGLLIDRGGAITHVVVGDAHRIFLPDFGRVRAGRSRFRGLRLVLTHLNGEPLSRDNLTDLSVLRLDLCLVVHVLQTGRPGPIEFAYLVPPNPAGKVYKVEKYRSIHDLKDDFQSFIRALEAEFARAVDGAHQAGGQERAMLIGVNCHDRVAAEKSLEELARLATTAGLFVVDTDIQTRRKIDPRYVVGKGKLEDIIVRSMQRGADVLVFDMDLRPSQLRSISERTDLKVLDRTQLILDIFAQHAESRAGKLQVEVAQLRYILPRLNIMTTAMSRLTGGIGGRGPGETKLEINKRRAKERLTRLNRALAQLRQEREERRKTRRRSAIPVVALVGYTNSGKSTLLNRLTHSSVRAEDRLFATLDPVSRRFRFPEQREIILIDTVGFIRNLPPDLMAAFRATMEEIEGADLILHLVDAGEEDPEPHIQTVVNLLADLRLDAIPRLLVWSKIDTAPPDTTSTLVRRFGGIPVSAVRGDNLDLLMDRIEQALWKPGRPSLRPAHRAHTTPS